MLTLPAYAKINLTLEVLWRRADGYHEVRSLLQTIDLADTLHFQSSTGLELVSDLPGLAPEQNLVMKAAELLQRFTGCNKGARISLTKRIPIAAGLGGGSSDAAATLHGLDQLWGLELPPESLHQLASELGSDVVFFLHGGAALAEGRGERVTPLSPSPSFWVVLLKPPIEAPADKTRRLYAALSPEHFTSGQLTQKAAELLQQGLPLPLFNVFEEAAFGFFPGLEEHRRWFLEAGAPDVHLAGSGPVLFTLMAEPAQANDLARRLGQGGHQVYLARAIGGY